MSASEMTYCVGWGVKLYSLTPTEAMRVNDLSKVALDSAAAGIEHATSIRKSNDHTTVPLSRT